MRETVAGESTGVEQLTVTAGSAPAPVPGEAGAAWVDLVNPTPEQDREVLARLGVDIPTREEMEEIESSSRVYEENGVAYLTALVVCRTDSDEPGTTPVSFVLTPAHLVTVRFADLTPFRAFAARCARQPKNAETSATAFAGLIEAIVDRYRRRTGAGRRRARQGLGRGLPAQAGRGRPAPARAAGSGRAGRAHRPPPRPALHGAREPAHATARGDLRAPGGGRVAARGGQGAAGDRRTRRALADGARRAPDPEGRVPARRDAGADQQPAEQDHQDLLGGGGGVHAANRWSPASMA